MAVVEGELPPLGSELNVAIARDDDKDEPGPEPAPPKRPLEMEALVAVQAGEV